MKEKKVRDTAAKREKLKKSYRKKKMAVIIAILFIYIVIVAAATVLIDDRHVVISLHGDEVQTVEIGTPFVDSGAEAWLTGNLFGRMGPEIEVSTQNGVSTDADGRTTEIGEFTVTYTAAALGGSAETKRTVRVVDTTPPEITLNHIDGYLASWLVGYDEEGFSAMDNYDGDITGRVVRTEVDDKVYYSVADSAGNETTVERDIVYGISEPMIKLTGGSEVNIEASFFFNDPGYEAIDESGNDLTSYVQVTGSVTPYLVGTYQLSYSITNERGETAIAQRTVNIIPKPLGVSVTPEEKTIYLTFDDGPGPYTEQLLNVLAKYDVKATFFVTGRAPEYNDMIGRAYREGHSIGVHTYTHDYGTVYASEQAYFDDFWKTEELIYEQTGAYTDIFRFPGGASNTVSRNYNAGIMTRLAKYMTDMGYKYFDWNVASGDAGQTTSTERVYQNVVDGCSVLNTCIVLQHDIKGFSVAAVERIIIWGLNHGYQFRALDQTSFCWQHPTAN